MVVDIELAVDQETCKLPLVVDLIPIHDEAIETVESVGGVLEEEPSGGAVETISLDGQSIVVVKSGFDSDDVVVVVVSKHNVADLVLDEHLGQKRHNPPKFEVMGFVGQVDL